MPQHPLASKIGWIKLGIGLLIVIVGVITSFQITVNKTTVVQPAAVKQSLVVPAAPTRTYMPEVVCKAISHDTKIDDLVDRYKTQKDDTGLLWWNFPLAEDQNRECTVHHDDTHVEAVDLQILGF